MEITHTTRAANKSMSVTIPVVRGAVDTSVALTDAETTGLAFGVKGMAEGGTEGLAEGGTDGESETMAEGEINGEREGTIEGAAEGIFVGLVVALLTNIVGMALSSKLSPG
jgi:hypothetical protein